MHRFRHVLGLILAAAAIVAGLTIASRRPQARADNERPQQLVATSAAIANAVGHGCVAIQASPGTGNMLAQNLTIGAGQRELLLSCAFQNTTTVSVILNGTAILLLSGSNFTAGQLFGPIAIPVEPTDTVNFQLSVANNGASTYEFKVEAVAEW